MCVGSGGTELYDFHEDDKTFSDCWTGYSDDFETFYREITEDMEKAQENAQAIVEFLLQEKKVTKVYYPGIEGTKAYEICKKQASGFGSMLTFEVESKELALHILKSTKLIPFAESLGGVETLLTYPTTQTHADVPEEVRIRNGITDRVLRLSVGIEDKADLIADLRQAIDSYR